MAGLHEFRLGDLVQVVHGTHKGIKGKVTRIEPTNQSVRLEFNDQYLPDVPVRHCRRLQATSGLKPPGAGPPHPAGSAVAGPPRVMQALAEAVRKNGMPPEQIFMHHKADRNGKLTVDEFSNAIRAIPAMSRIEQGDLVALFKFFDKDGSGSVDIREFCGTLAAEAPLRGREVPDWTKQPAAQGPGRPGSGASGAGAQRVAKRPAGAAADGGTPTGEDRGRGAGRAQPEHYRSNSNPPTSSQGSRHEDEASLALIGDKGGGDSGRLPLENSSYDWIRKANGPWDRELRRRSAEMTISACRARGYTLDGERVVLQHIDAMVQGTCFVRAAAGGIASQSAPSSITLAKHSPGLLLPVALERSKAGCKVVAVNAASAFSVGGGFFHGGRHALEESMCMQSTLFQSLLEAQRQAHKGADKEEKGGGGGGGGGGGVLGGLFGKPSRPQRPHFNKHIPDDAVVLSPKVEIFRAGTFEGYPFLPWATMLAGIVSMAAFNCNPRMRDAPVDRPASDADYEALLVSKFQAVLEACGRVAADVLVMPDIGCGVYMNDPLVVGRLFGQTLRTSPVTANLREVHLVGIPEFASSAEAAFLGQELSASSAFHATGPSAGRPQGQPQGQPPPAPVETMPAK